jgi:hypothetical protein
VDGVASATGSSRPKPVSDGYEIAAAKGTLVGARSLAGEEPLLNHFFGGRVGDLFH